MYLLSAGASEREGMAMTWIDSLFSQASLNSAAIYPRQCDVAMYIECKYLLCYVFINDS